MFHWSFSQFMPDSTTLTEAGPSTDVCYGPLDATDISVEEAVATASLFKALGDQARVRIVNLLATGSEPLCVCHLIEPLGLSQGTVSHHLKKLLDVGLLRREQRGIWAYYSLDRTALGRLAVLVGRGWEES